MELDTRPKETSVRKLTASNIILFTILIRLKAVLFALAKWNNPWAKAHWMGDNDDVDVYKGRVMYDLNTSQMEI